LQVILFLSDGYGFQVPLAGAVETPLFLGNYSQLVISGGNAIQVAMLLTNGEGFQIVLPRRLEVSTLLGNPSQIVMG